MYGGATSFTLRTTGVPLRPAMSRWGDLKSSSSEWVFHAAVVLLVLTATFFLVQFIVSELQRWVCCMPLCNGSTLATMLSVAAVVLLFSYQVCHRFVVGVPMFWLFDHCPDLLRSAGVKVKVCLRTAAALISVSIFVIDFGLIWNPHHSVCLMLDSWSRKRHVELVAIFAGSWWILNCFCVGRWFIHQLKIRHSLCFIWFVRLKMVV
jgi:hypothetical protein